MSTGTRVSFHIADRVYSLLLRAYPPDFRGTYGREMLMLFRDQRRDDSAIEGVIDNALVGGIRFWVAILLDVCRSAPPLRLHALRTRLLSRAGRPSGESRHFQLEDRIMTTKQIVATLGVLGGAFEILSTASEAWAGKSMNHGTGWLLALALGVLMGASLLASGVAMLRPGGAATRFAQGAALSSLALVVGMHFVFPYMSIFSILVAAVISLALLVMGTRAGGDRGMPSVA